MIGVDLVDIDRLREVLQRSPRLENRLFSGTERSYCRSKSDPAKHFAGTLAAKEAVIKAARLGALGAWARRVEITRDAAGAPAVSLDGEIAPISASISHDGGIAVAAAMMLPARDHSSR